MMNNSIDYAAKARLEKAHRLVAALRAAGATVDQLDELGDKFPWDVAVEAAGVRPPSDATKELVRDTLVFLERMDKQNAGRDLFEGLA